jgi:tripartite-type tricarboxylate transporter receptor subunit TctC
LRENVLKLHYLLPLLALACANFTHAQNYPARNIVLMVPAPAGGPTDIVGRLIGQMLAAEIGQQVIIENRGGAGNMIGTSVTAKAKPDGYSLVAAPARCRFRPTSTRACRITRSTTSHPWA